MRRFLKFAIVAGAIGALVGASISIAASSGTGGASRTAAPQKHGLRFHRPPFARGAVLKSAADKLGVSPADLRKALRAGFESVGPPQPPKSMDRNSLRQAMEQHCNAVTDAVGKSLGKSGDDVRSAFKAALKEQVAKAQSAGRITAAQANRLNAKIDADACALPHPGGPGCGPGGPGPMGGPPPGEYGQRQDGSQNQQQSDSAPAIDVVPA